MRRKIGIASLGALAAIPLVVLAALAFSDRGIGGTISDRWHDLTSADSTPQNDPGRLIETGSVRTIYWGRAIDVWKAHKVAGAGAGSFAEAQLKYRDQNAQAKHAHGYIHQTLADLGLLGLAVSLAALAAWLLAVRRTLGLRNRTRRDSDWTPERLGIAALTLVAVVFGVHSAVDWTWFVPALAVTGIFCAGWVAGRGPVLSDEEAPPADAGGPRALADVSPELPSGRGRRVALGAAAAVLAFALLTSVAVSQPWRSERKGNDALALTEKGDFKGGLAAAGKAEDLDPLSVDPYFDRAAVEDAANDKQAALRSLERAVQVQPASPEAWQRLGEYHLNRLNQPSDALPIIRAAIYLDPLSQQSRNDLLTAIRAEQAQLAQRAAAAAQRRARAKSVRGKSGAPPAAASSTSP